MPFLSDDLKKFLKNNYFSFGVYACVLLGIIPLISLNKYTINVWVNHNVANYSIDPFFIFYSNCFEGYIHVVTILVFAFISRRKFFLFLIQALLVGVLVYVFKEVVFGNIPRPTKLLGYETFSHILKDTSVYKENFSFPSGHTMSAFAVMSMFAYLSKSHMFQLFLFLFAFIAGFSRIYLLQHFFIDTYFGMILGFLTTILTIKIIDSIQFVEKPLIGTHSV